MAIDSPARRLLCDEEATSKIDAGVAVVAKYVGMTMGPKGWNVAIRLDGVGEGKIVNTKDGVFVAQHIKLPDPEEDIGAQMAVQASQKTNDAAGDGTTATVVLLDAMLQEARKHVKMKSNSIRIQEGMQRETELIVEFLRKISNPIEKERELYDVALVSCQDKDIAKKISDIILKVGKFGTVGVQAMTGPLNIDLRVENGMFFEIGFEARLTHMSSASVMGQLQKKGSVQKLSWENDNVGVLIFDEPVRQWNDVAHIFSACVSADRRKLLIIGDIHDDAAAGLQAQMMNQIFSAVTINRANFGGDLGREILKDIAVFCGAQFLSPLDGTMPNKNQNITNIDAILGTCVASVGMESFILTKGAGSQDDIDARCALIMQTVESGSMPDYEKQKYKERIARFKAGIGTITIFAPTDVQQTSIRTRVDDAVCAVRSANEEGIVAGGGVALLRCHQYLMGIERQAEDKDTMAGREIVRQALLCPARKIAEMAGEEAAVRLEQLMRHPHTSTIGYNYWTEKEADLIKDGILDPTKVVRLCVENAVSVVGELLRTRATSVPLPKDDTDEPYLTPRERALRVHNKRAQQG